MMKEREVQQQKESHLTLAERLGRQEVADGIAKGEFHLSKTDKSSRLVLATSENYLRGLEVHAAGHRLVSLEECTRQEA